MNNRGRFIENLKFPSLRQRVKSDSSVEIGVVEGSVPVQRRLSCVLPDVSGRKEEPNFGVAPLRQQDVEKWNDNFDPVKSTSGSEIKPDGKEATDPMIPGVLQLKRGFSPQDV